MTVPDGANINHNCLVYYDGIDSDCRMSDYDQDGDGGTLQGFAQIVRTQMK